MDLYFFPFFFSFLISGVGIGTLLFLQKRFSIFQKERIEEGRKQEKNISRLGGVMAGAAFLLTIFLDPSLVMTRDVWGLAAGCLGMLAVGWWDDRYPIAWKMQLFLQVFLVGSIVFLFGTSVSSMPNPFGERIFFEGFFRIFLGGGIMVAWCMLLMNALNWSDGIDGVAPGIVVLAALAFFAVSMRPEVLQPPVAILALALLGSYLGLFVCNLYPAKIFSGTAGVYVAGFAIAYMSLFAGVKVATALLVLGIPIADLIRVMMLRYRSGVPMTFPDKMHLHHQFLRLGWSERSVSFLLLSIVTFISILTFVLGTIGKVCVIVFLFICFFFVTGYFFTKKRT